MSANRPPAWTTGQTLEEIRPEVRSLLTAVPAFAELSPAERSKLAGNMVKVLSYIANPNGVMDDLPAHSTAARALAEEHLDSDLVLGDVLARLELS